MNETMDFSAVWARVLGQAAPESGLAGQLEAFLRGAWAAGRLYAGLAARTGGRARQILRALAGEERSNYKKLEAEYYLATGKNCPPAPSGAESAGPILEALRRQYGLELSNAKALEKCAALCADARLAARLRGLAAGETCHAARVLRLLETAL